MSPVELSPASQTASDLPTLWAQPSKEWIIPAKPKPGRKPKKESTSGIAIPENDHEQVPSGSRRVQNRQEAAQRAFRERKQTQLAELQARLHSYEQGEIERSVALQNIAKKTKDENEELRKENQILKEKISRLEKERDLFLDKDKKRAHDDTSTPSLSFPLIDYHATKRVRIEEDKQDIAPSPVQPLHPSSPFTVPHYDVALAGSVSPRAHENLSQHPIFPAHPQGNSFVPFATRNKAAVTPGGDTIKPLSCILCSPDAPCICGQVTVERTDTSNPPSQDPRDQSIISLDQSVHHHIPSTTSPNILNNPPAFQAPVPIRRKPGGASRTSVFPVTPLAKSPLALAPKCSGDPDNCIACANDNFGKAFCQVICHTLNSSLPCGDCPKRASQTGEILVGGCCGDFSQCGSCGIAPNSSFALSRGRETIPTDDAWRQLKSHPNVAFADLTLLAEVVARRSKCTGSRVVLSPALESATLNDNASLSDPESTPAKNDQPVLLTDSLDLEDFHQKQGLRESPQLVPQHVLIECGQRKMREVNADGVREALRLLDQKFAHTR